VLVAESKAKPGQSAVKFHGRSEPYHREKRIYQRLAEHSVTEIRGFHVPQLLSFNDHFRAIEMTIVKKPFILDFAGASLDRPPSFPKNVMLEWERENRNRFGPRRNAVENLIRAFRDLDIYLLDISPNNVAFRDEKE
jgi:hypothetical protein